MTDVSNASQQSMNHQPMRSIVIEWESLHFLPSLIVCGGAFFVVLLMNVFLQRMVLSASDHAAVFSIGGFMCFSSYFMIYYFLNEYAPSFRRISKEKQFYTISNLMKAGILAAIFPFAVMSVPKIFFYDGWVSEANTLRNLGCIYAIPDFVSLLIVRRMAWSTILHHIAVCLLNLASVQNDYGSENICRLIVVYAAFSTFAYVVYMLLASRFLGLPKILSKILSLGSLGIFLLCCICNWCMQTWYLHHLIVHHNHWSIYLYIPFFFIVAYDDVHLIQWLLTNVRTLMAGSGAWTGRRAGPTTMQQMIS